MAVVQTCRICPCVHQGQGCEQTKTLSVVLGGWYQTWGWDRMRGGFL